MRVGTETRIRILIITVLFSNVSLSRETRWKPTLRQCLAADLRTFLLFIATCRSHERRPVMTEAEKDRAMDIMLAIARRRLLPSTRRFFWPWRPWRPWWRPAHYPKPGFQFVGLGVGSFHVPVQPSGPVSSGSGTGMHPYNAPGYGPGYPNAEPLTTPRTTTATTTTVATTTPTTEIITPSLEPLTTPVFPPVTSWHVQYPDNDYDLSGPDGVGFNNGGNPAVGYGRSINLAGTRNVRNEIPGDQTLNVDNAFFDQGQAAIGEWPNHRKQIPNDCDTHNVNVVNPNEPLDHWNPDSSRWNPAGSSKNMSISDNDPKFYWDEQQHQFYRNEDDNGGSSRLLTNDVFPWQLIKKHPSFQNSKRDSANSNSKLRIAA